MERRKLPGSRDSAPVAEVWVRNTIGRHMSDYNRRRAAYLAREMFLSAANAITPDDEIEVAVARLPDGVRIEVTSPVGDLTRRSLATVSLRAHEFASYATPERHVSTATLYDEEIAP